MKSVLYNLFGSYDPIVVSLTDGSEVVTPDYEYIFGILLFSLVTYCVFRLIGGMFSGGFRK